MKDETTIISTRTLNEIKELIDDLQWDYDRMSSSGQETYDLLRQKIGGRLKNNV